MRTVTGIVLGIVFACVAARAQTSQISGTIKDPSGSPIPAAAVRATQTATGVVRNAVSGNDGRYILADLPVGPYQLEVTKEGFARYVQSGIVLQVDSNPTVDVSLQVGAVSEQVSVEANAVQVETRSTAIGSVVTNQQVAEMPLNGRDPHELIFLAGMATYPGAGSYNTIRNYPTIVVSVAGGNGDSVTYLLDGTLWQDPYNSLSLPLPFPDALQEFKVETSAMPAQYGFHASAAVNIVTKSGTNEYHGDLFEFLRNGDLNARDFNAAARDTLKRNQFGGVIGGPVLPRLKNKLFFFGGYQRTSLRSDGSQNTAFIPTPASLQGDFTTLASPTCNNGAQKTLSPALGFVNNTIAPSLLSTVAVNIAKTLPVTANPCGRTTYGLVVDQDENLYVAKVDYQISDKHSIFGRFVAGHLASGSTYDGKDPLSINTYANVNYDYGLNVGDTYIINPNLVNSFRIGANRTNLVKIPDNYGSWAAFGSNFTPLGGNNIQLTVTSAFSIGGGNAALGTNHNGPLPSVGDDLTWIRGSHQIQFGGTIYQQRMNIVGGSPALGQATVDGSITGLPLGDFMMGRFVTFAPGTIYGFYIRQFYSALYVQDSWKVTPRLTVNYGLRWEPFQAPYNNRQENEHFNPALFAAGQTSSVFVNAPPGLVFPGDSAYTCGDAITCSDLKKFFPRLGLAWDPLGNGKMTVRAGYGMFGDRSNMLNGTAGAFSLPFGNQISLSGIEIDNPWANYPGGNPMPTLASIQGIGVYSHNAPFYPGGSYINWPLAGFKPMYMNQWNLSVQRQVGRDWLLTANYVGNNTIHLLSSESINPAVYIPGNCSPGQYGLTVAGPCSSTSNSQARRVLNLQNPATGQYYAAVGQADDGGTGEYEGLYISAKKQLSHGLTAQANYTWSHCISDVYNQNNGSGGNAPPGDRRQYRSNCIGLDLRQLFVLNLVATTPRFSNRALRILGSDWQVAPILEIKSAQEFSVFTGTDRALTTVGSQPPNLVNLNPYPATQTASDWINASAFAPAALGTYGNLGYNNMKGPGVFQLNLALSRIFSVGEKRMIQLRAEAFNLPNHLNLFAPGAAPNSGQSGASVTLNSSNFGQITNDISGNNGLQGGDYRVIQVAMKFVF